MKTALAPEYSRSPSPTPREKSPPVSSTERLSAPYGAGNQAMLRLLHLGAIQAKLTVNRPGDAHEREADTTAEQVMRMPTPLATTLTSPALIQRKCAACQEEEGETVQRKETAGQALVTPSGQETNLVPRSGAGEPLPPTVRQFFEPRFGKDFSGVRVHTDERAAQAAQSIRARAFTLGANIAFARGEYAPETLQGRTLLAHELTHTIQQGRASGPKNQAQREPQDKPGTSTFDDHVLPDTVVTKTPGGYEGKVRRDEFDPHGKQIHEATVNVRYDENACKVTLPTRVRFRHPQQSDLGLPSAGQLAPTTLPKPMDATDFDKVRREYLREANERLNGWYSVRLDNCAKSPCQGKDIPIQVEITEATAGSPAEYDIVLLNMEGRAYVSYADKAMYLFSNDHDSATYAHESLHMTLGGGDEYHESNRNLPQNPSRERENDWSLAADSSGFRGWALLHERHFSHVVAFLKYLRPFCPAKLIELQRPLKFTLGINVAAGYVNYGGASGLTLGGGLMGNLPVTRLRDWNLAIGAQARLLATLDSPMRMAFLTGLRVGLEHTNTPSAGGLHLGVFGEAGRGSFDRLKPGSARSVEAGGGAYAEIGGSIGYRFAPVTGISGVLGAEAAGGLRLPDLKDPQNEKWFRAGLIAGFQF